MDTPDKASGFADPALAEAINRDWLLVSASSQLSTGGSRQRSQARWMTRSYSVNDDTDNKHHQSRRDEQLGLLNKSFEASCNESSWLLRSKGRARGSRFPRNPRRLNTYGGTRALLYDNISFADSSLHIRSLNSRKNSLQPGDDFEDNESRIENSGRFRIILACYLLVGITLAIYSRNCLSLVAVEMVASNKINKELMADPLLANLSSKVAQDDNSCPVMTADIDFSVTNSTTPRFNKEQLMAKVKQKIERGELVDWTPGEQGLIFASGSVGNLLIAIPLTRLGEIYGPKWIIFLALTGATLQAALMPIVAGAHVSLVILFQIIFNGLTFGADCVAYTFFAQWLTPTEVAFFVACLLVCYQLGAMISSAITAKILVEGIAWCWCFYTPAILCAIWTVIWAFIGDSEPARSWIISDREFEYLLKSSKISQLMLHDTGSKCQSSVDLLDKQADKASGKPHAVSWRKMAKDPNIWAIVAVKFTLRWYFSVYNSMMPTYLSSVAHMSISKIGEVSVFQSFVGLFSGLLMSYLTKSIVTKRPFNLQLATVRKISQSIVNFGLSLSLLAFITFDCNQWITIVSLTISGICLNGFYVAAALQLPIDLSPDHCGLITSISNTLALGQALGAPVSGLILNHGPRSRIMWRIVWGLAIILNALSGLLFIFLVDSKTRDYNDYTTAMGGGKDEQARSSRDEESEQRAKLLGESHCRILCSGKSFKSLIVR